MFDVAFSRCGWFVVASLVSVASASPAVGATGSSDSGSSGSPTDTGGPESSSTDGNLDTSGGETTGGPPNNCSDGPPGVEIIEPMDGATVPTSFSTRATATPRCYCDELEGSGCWDREPSVVRLYVDTSSEAIDSIEGSGQPVVFAVELAPGEHTLTVEAFWGGDDGYSDLERTDMIEVQVDAGTADGGSAGTGGPSDGGGAGPVSDGGCGCTNSPRGAAWLTWLLPLLLRRQGRRRGQAVAASRCVRHQRLHGSRTGQRGVLGEAAAVLWSKVWF